MSRATRLRAADGRFIPTKPDTPAWPSITLNSANVPGGISAVPLPGPLVAAGLSWAPEDAEPHASSIGYALALEMAGPS